MANLIVLQDGTLATVSPVNNNFAALNNEVRSVDRGGTGQNSLTAGSVLVGNGTSPIIPVTGSPGSILVFPGGGGLPVPQTIQSGYFNFCTNGSFEDWSQWPYPYGWTPVGSAAAASAVGRSTGLVGQYSLRVTNPGTVACGVGQNILQFYPWESGATGGKFTFGCYVLATRANQARIDIISDAGSMGPDSSSPQHPGDSVWHWLTCTGTVPLGSTQVIVRCLSEGFSDPVAFDLATVVTATTGAGLYEFIPSPPLVQTGHFNYLFNGDFEIWGAGTTAKPTGWNTFSGRPIAKVTGAGQFISGTASCVVTLAAGQTETLFQKPSQVYPPAAQYANRTMTLGAWAWSNVPSTMSLALSDDASVNVPSAQHPGDGQWHWLTVTATLSASPVACTCYLNQGGGGGANYFWDMVTCVDGAYLPAPVPSGWRGRKAILQFASGPTAMPVALSFYGLGRNSTVSATDGSFVTSPFARGVMRNFKAISHTALSAATAARLLKDGADTALAANFSAAGGLTTPLVTGVEVEVTPVNALAIRTNPNVASVQTASVEIEEVPDI